MKLLILGSSGFVGKHFIKEALQQNHQLKLLIRDENKIKSFNKNIELIKFDYLKDEFKDEFLKDIDAVVYLIGAPIGYKKNLNKNHYKKAMERLILAMEKNKIKRIITLTSAGTRYKDEKVSFLRQTSRTFISLIAPLVIPSKEEELKVLCKSKLLWTSFRPPLIKKSIKGKTYLSNNKVPSTKLAVEDLCKKILTELYENKYLKQAPFISTVKS